MTVTTDCIDIEPSWRAIAEIAIGLIEDGTGKGKASGREIIRDMGKKLAAAREKQIQHSQIKRVVINQ